MRVSLLLALVLLFTPSLVSQLARCAPTPEAAASAAVGAPRDSYSSSQGFRVQNVEVDVITRRVWVRVRRCDDEAAPTVLVPMNAGFVAAEPFPVLNRSGVSINATQRDIVVKPGDTVRVFFASDRVRMDLEGRAVKSAAIGDRVEVILQHNADESEHRIHGTLRAQGMVEVQP